MSFWPSLGLAPQALENPIGKRFHIANDERTVVGVTGDVRVRGPMCAVLGPT